MEHNWDQYIEEGIAALPQRYREKIQNVAVLLEDDVSEEVRMREGLGVRETLLGLYQGVPLTERGDGYGIGAVMPDTITIYKRPTLEEAAETDGDVARVVRETIWHEFGHYFGLDEDEVQQREGARFRR
jgi:predicted Zn-dependent protease with MMP-like domain